MPKKIYKKTEKGLERIGVLPSLTEWDGKINKSGDTMTGNLTIKQGSAINVSQYNDAGGVSLMNNGNGTATQFGSSARPARMFSSVQPEWYKNGVSQGVLAIKSDIPDISGKVNKAGDTMTGNLTPAKNKGASLGTSSLYWSNIYGTTIYENGKTLSETYVKYSAEQSLNDAQKAQARKNIGAGTITEIKVNGTSKGTSGSVNLTNMVTFASSQTATVAGTSKTTYTYNQPAGDSNTNISKGSAYFPEGIIMGGTAASAGLVTRGICGVTTPDATTGACDKENLYINYDGNNNYSRKVVLGAGSAGNEIANSSGAYTYSAVRGDQMVSYVTNYVPGAIKTWFDSNVHIPSIKTLNTNNSSIFPVSSSEAISGSGSINLHKVSKTGKFSDLSNRGEAFLSWGGQNLVGAYGPIDSAMIPDLGANRLAFIPPAGISVEYSRDSGTTWQDYGATDAQKLGLTSTGTSFIIGKADSSNKATERYMLRISLHTSDGKVYTQLNKFALYVSTNGSNGSYCTIRARTQDNYLNKVDKWVVFANKQSIAGWSGWNIINTSTITTYGNTASSQYGEIQFIFGCTSGSTSYVGLQILRLMGFGGVGWTTPSTMAKTGHIYNYDTSQNVTFPASISAAGSISAAASFKEGGQSLADKYLGKKAKAADSDKLDGNDSTYYLNYKNLSNTPTLGTAASKNTGTSPNNVPILDSNGKLADSVIPAVAITDTYVVATKDAMLALSAQKGDIAIRSDLNKSFVLQATPASTPEN